MITIDILLVDDADADALITTKVIQRSTNVRLKARISRARNLAEMSCHLARNSYSCILLDLSLPDSEGVSTATAAVSSARGAVVILLSGSNLTTLLNLAAETGASGAIEKKALSASDDILEYIASFIDQSNVMGQ